MSIYQEHEFKNREAYLRDLADEYGVDVELVFALADALGPGEDFDGLVSSLWDL